MQLIVVANGQLKVSRSDCLFLMLRASVACKFEDLADEVLENSSGKNTSALADTFGVSASLKQPVQPTCWEDQVASGRGGLPSLATCRSFAFTCHMVRVKI